MVRSLTEALSRRGLLPDFDLAPEDPGAEDTGISAEDEWWTRLEQMITRADVIVFVISRASAASRVCDQEVAFARAAGKRIIPVLGQSVDYQRLPPHVAALNIEISFVDRDSEAFDQSVEELVGAIERDVEWLRQSTQLTVEAMTWHSARRPPDQLLRGAEIRRAQELVARRPDSAPPTSDVVLDFLTASQEDEDERHAMSVVAKARYLELDRVARSMLEEELRVREEAPPTPPTDSYWVIKEAESDLELIRGLLGKQKNWHPEAPQHVGHGGAVEGYPEIYQFPCCDTSVWVYTQIGYDVPPSQFRADGCREIPKEVQYEALQLSNPFRSSLVGKYVSLKNQSQPEPAQPG